MQRVLQQRHLVREKENNTFTLNRRPCLQRVDEDAAAVVARHLRLLDQRDRRHEGLDRRGVLPVGRVLRDDDDNSVGLITQKVTQVSN